VNLGRR